MTTRLRSLRVTAEMDSSGYARGAQAKAAADNAMISSGDRFGASLANTDMQLNKLPAGMARLSRMWLSGYSEAEKFEKAVRQVGNAIDHGMDLDRAVTMLKAIETQFGRTANAAQLAKQGFVSLAAPLATVNADRFQSGLNASLGVGAPGKSAHESASVFAEAAAIEQERMAVSAKALRAEIDPLGAAQDRLNAELAEYTALANSGAITTGELAAAQQMATTRFGALAQNMAATAKSGGLARHQMANLSYQLNDVATMLASGQAPFMLFMQQGMQIGQLLGPQGLQSGVKALGLGIVSFLTNPVNLAVVGFAGLAAGAGYAFRLMKSDLPTVEELLKSQKELLSELSGAYQDIGREVAKMGNESTRVLEFQASINIEQSKERIQKELQSALVPYTLDLTAAFGAGGEAKIENKFLPFKDVILDVFKAIETGQGDVIKFREEIADIGKGFEGDKAIAKMQAELYGALDGVKALQLQTNQFGATLDPLASKLSNLFAGGPREMLGEERGNRKIYDFLPDNRSQQQQLQDSYAEFLKKSGQDATLLGEANRVVAEVQAVLNAELAKTVALNELDIRSIYAKSPAQKAAIAAERERVNAINAGIGADELAIRMQHASTMAYQEATYAITEQNRARIVSANDNISTSRLELSLIGAGAAAQAEARANLASFLDLKRQAEANGLGFDQAYYELLKGQNHELSILVELTARQKLATDLDRERSYLGMSGREADIQQRLLSSGIEEGTGDWQDRHDELLAMKEFQDSMFYGFKTGFDDIRADANDFASSTKGIVTDLYGGMEDALVEFVKTGKVNFQSLTDQMIEDIARMSYKLAMSGMLNLLMGGSPSNTSGMGGILGKLLGGGFQPGATNNGLYAKGDVFGAPTMFGYGNGKMGVMGEDGPEAVVPLARGRDGKLGIAGGGQGGVTINQTTINSSSKATARTEVTDRGNGQFDIRTMIEDVVVDTMAGHKGNQLMSGIYGVGRQVRSR